MPNFDEALKILYTLEFSNPENALHINPTEETYTFMGIYEKANPSWEGWNEIYPLLKYSKGLKETSRRLFFDEKVQSMVAKFYKEHFWNKMRLYEINSKLKANEIFIFGVNAGTRAAIKLAQRVVGVEDDGNMGENTLRAVNLYDEDKFDKEYDRLEMQYYNRLMERNPKFKIYANGWRKRAYAV